MIFKTMYWNEIIQKKYVDVGKEDKVEASGDSDIKHKEVSKGKGNEMASEMERNLERRVSQYQKRECLERKKLNTAESPSQVRTCH